MFRSLQIASTGMVAQETKLDTIANNLANANTSGYKRQDAEFEDLRYGRSFTIGACNERTLSNTVRAIGNANLTDVHANRD